MDNQNSNPMQALVERLQQSTNILVTVSSNPSVDQLAACLGLTLWLNKIGKHGTAVFSGEVPSTLEFLQPADTLEKNTDSLRDFIIALDKTKADKLRYKVEDSVVKIFITPYRTNLTADDLEYSQGDFNVDMVIALGVAAQQDLDGAITAHGRILHDAAVATIMTNASSELGSINWQDAGASSLSELITELGNSFGQDQLDGQIATALLTGIVAETARFSNEKTTPQTMSISAQLMAAGANQQLVASELEAPKPESEALAEPTPEPKAPADTNDAPVKVEAPAVEPKPEDGTLEIDHEANVAEPDEAEVSAEPPLPTEEEAAPEFPPLYEVDDNHVAASEPLADDQPMPAETAEAEAEPPISTGPSKLMTEPPTMGGMLTANSRPEDLVLEPTSDPMSQASEAEQPLIDHAPMELPAPEESAEEPAPTAAPDFQPAPPAWMPQQTWMTPAADEQPDQASDQPPAVPADEPQTMTLPDSLATQPANSDPPSDPPLQPYDPDDTLTEIEQSVHSPHLQPSADQPDLGSARDEVMQALNSVPDANPAPVQALNAQPIDLNQAEPAAQTNAPGGSTTFDPALFETLNDTNASTQNSALDSLQPSVPTMQPALDPDLTTPVEQPFTMPLPQALAPPPANPMPPTSTVTDPTAPPPVPPPLMPPMN